jgi:polysaccharide pyruvyl transferase WcaK-like protein
MRIDTRSSARGVDAVQICDGLGAGNIGDELMARAFWDALPDTLSLEVEVFPNEAIQREAYPSTHRYARLRWDGSPFPENVALPGLLVGDTPVAETLGVDWPLRFIGARLDAFHRAGRPVDAVGAGVEPLRSDEARALFRRYFLPIRSWTVRTATCRQTLLDLGASEDRVAVGADWAWLYRTKHDRRVWGAATWRELGVDPTRPLLVVNAINEIWRGQTEAKRALAAALDTLISEVAFQVAFFCQEMREGEFFDLAAARETISHMRRSAVIVPNLYYSPDEVLGLLAHATATLAGRYHFVVASVLAGSVPVCIARSEKMEGLLEELDLPPAGRIESARADSIVAAVRSAVASREELRRRLDDARCRLETRAQDNLSLWSRYRGPQLAPRAGH